MEPKRFLLFADFLGTTDTYSRSIELVVKRRELLEQTLAAYALPALALCDINLYVFSDTAIMTCPRLQPLLDIAARMFRHFSEITVDQKRLDHDTALLRAAICYGTTAQSNTLSNSSRVTVIPMLDDSLPRAYKLEGIRRGSRVFVDLRAAEELAADCRDLHHWRFITGRGDPRPDIFEFFWPRGAYESDQDLLAATERVRRFWLGRLKSAGWGLEYEDGVMPHLDETLKLFVRSLAAKAEDDTVCRYLFDMLPASEDEIVDVKFEWGVWFQSLKALWECTPIRDRMRSELMKRSQSVREFVEKREYWAHFRTELEMPDYSGFKDLWVSAGL